MRFRRVIAGGQPEENLGHHGGQHSHQQRREQSHWRHRLFMLKGRAVKVAYCDIKFSIIRHPAATQATLRIPGAQVHCYRVFPVQGGQYRLGNSNLALLNRLC